MQCSTVEMPHFGNIWKHKEIELLNLLLPSVFAFTLCHYLPISEYLISSIAHASVGQVDLVGYLLTCTMLFDEGVMFLLERTQGSM